MGEGKHYSSGNVRLTKSQRNRIKPNETGGSWYAKVDPDTGAVQWIRRKIKRRKKR